MKTVIVVTMALLLATAPGSARADDDHDEGRELTREERLGKQLFFEEALSEPGGMSCATCHDPAVAFSDPETGLPVSRGAVSGRFGNRNDQPAAYASFIPPLHKDPEEGIWVGGLFWDGRVNTLEEQAQAPPLNILEMANADTVSVAATLRRLPYAGEFLALYGEESLKDPHTAYASMARAIAAYERTEEFHPFDSKYDMYLDGKVELTDKEQRGLTVFVAEDKGNCAACHPHLPGEDGTPPLFTDFTYDNLGTPRNPELPYYTLPAELNPHGWQWVDRGLGATVDDPAEDGKFRVPTLRNVAVTGPYMHNGVFKTLFEAVAFYNSRDVGPWPEPETANAVNRDELGNLGLTNGEMDDLVAFLHTLTDGYDD